MDLASLRASNRGAVLRLLHSHGRLTQPEIARLSGLSRGSVINIVRELADEGAVRRTAVSHDGRTPVEVSLNPDGSVIAAVDFGNRHLRVAIADPAHNVLAEQRIGLAQGHSAVDGIDRCVETIRRLLGDAGRQRDDLSAIGVGLPGPIVDGSGRLAAPAILPAWADTNVATQLYSALEVPVVVDNDANLGALAESLWGRGRGVSDFVYLKVSTGIGAGLFVNGQLCRGAVGTAGEIGHTTIDENGSICRCGNRGCLETVAAGPALVKSLQATYGDASTLEDLLSLAVKGDAGCRRLIWDAGSHIGVAVANICNLLSPEVLIVGGEMASVGELLLEPLRESVARRAVGVAAQTMQVTTSSLAERAVLLGAVIRALQERARTSEPRPSRVQARASRRS